MVKRKKMNGLKKSYRFSRGQVIFIFALILFLGFFAVWGIFAGSTEQLTFSPTDDAFVDKSRAKRNYGGNSSLKIESGKQETLLKFAVSDVAGRKVVSAKLRLYVTNSSNVGGTFYRTTDTSWKEKEVTWNNAPPADPASLATLGSVKSGNWYEADVTPAVLNDGLVSFRVNSSSADNIVYASKESGASKAPKLLVTVEDASSSDTSPPTASITSPASGSTVSGTVNVTANASDDTGVTKVEFFVDGALKSTDTSSPYGFSWNTTTIANGSHTLSAKAYDAAGNIGASANVVLTTDNTDSEAPTVSLTSPAPDATVSGTVSVSASASDNVGVAKVELFVDGALKATDTSSPYSFSWDTTTVSNGSHTLSAKAYDPSGNVGTSGNLSVSVNNTVTLSAPKNLEGWAASGYIINLAWEGTQPEGTTYVVYQNGSSKSSSSRTVATISSLNPNTSYKYYVEAKAPDGKLSSKSNEITVKTNPLDPTLRTFTTPEGATIEINNNAGFNYESTYRMLKQEALPDDFAKIAPNLTVKVQEQYSSQMTGLAQKSNGVYTTFNATIYLKAAGSSVFMSKPDYALAHEYGHVWTLYHLYMSQQGDWSSYLNFRWANEDGSVKLGEDSRLDSSYMWSRAEIIAEDYRLNFCSLTCFNQAPNHLNYLIPDNHPGLKEFFLNTWAVKP